MSNDLLERLKKLGSIKNSEILSQSKFFNEKDMIPTDNPSLNIALSGSVNGGLTPGVTFIAGPSGTYKTLMCLKLVSSYLNFHKDAICIFYDSEFGSSNEYLSAQGVDTDRVIHIPTTDIEEFKFDIVQKLKGINDGDHVIFLIDSIGNMASRKEVEDALEEKSVADMSRAKAMKSVFRMITPHITTKNIPLICVNHTYQEIGLYPKTIMSGGCLTKGHNIKLNSGEFKSIENIIVGDLVDTLIGPRPITAIWNPNTLYEGTPECFEVVFDDGSVVTCSNNHLFLDEDFNWKVVTQFKPGDFVISKF